MKKYIISLSSVFFILVLAFNTSFAQVPRVINYQASLIDADAKPLNGDLEVTFSIFDDESGAIPLWSETQTASCTNGFMNTYLGQNIPINLPFDKQYWIEVKISNNSYPRTKLTSSPYAIHAQLATKADTSDVAFTVVDGAITQAKLDPGVKAIPWGPAGGVLSGQYPNPTLNQDTLLNIVDDNFIRRDEALLGDLAGIAGLPTVARIRGIVVSPTAPTLWQTFVYDGTRWKPSLLEPHSLSSNVPVADKFLTVNSGTFTWVDLNVGTTLQGNGIGTALNINLTTSNSWTGQQFFTTSAPQSPVVPVDMYDLTNKAYVDGAVAGTSLQAAYVSGNIITTSAAEGSVTINGTDATIPLYVTATNSTGVFSTSTGSHGVWGITNSISGAGILGDNTFGEAVVGRNNGGTGVGAVVGRNDSSGYGVRGFNTDNGIGVLGQSGISGGTGVAGKFENVNAANTSTVVDVTTNGIGSGITVQLTNASNGARGIDVTHSGVGPGVFSTSAGGTGVWGITSSISAAGVIGDNTFGEAVVGRNNGGIGVGAVVGRNDSSGYGVRGFNTDNGIGVLGQTGISGGTGVAGRFENVNAANTNNTVDIVTNGSGGWALNVSATSTANGLLVTTDPASVGLSVVGGTKSAIVETSQGATALYCEESSEVWFTDYGIGRLINGEVRINVDPIFTETVNMNEVYHVFVQARGNSDLYTTNFDNAGFTVKASNGDMNVEFSYRIVAKRSGHENKRLMKIEGLENNVMLNSRTAKPQSIKTELNIQNLQSDNPTEKIQLLRTVDIQSNSVNTKSVILPSDLQSNDKITK